MRPSKVAPAAITDAVGKETEPADVGQLVFTAVWGQDTPPLACQVIVTGLVVVAGLVVLVVVTFLVVVVLVVVVLVERVVWPTARVTNMVVARNDNFMLIEFLFDW
jgi:hypothetical protein